MYELVHLYWGEKISSRATKPDLGTSIHQMGFFSKFPTRLVRVSILYGSCPRYIWISTNLLKSQTWATSPMTSWCSTRRWWSTASFFPVVLGNSLSQKIHGTWRSRFESSFTGCSGNAKTSKPCCGWIPVTTHSISKYLHEIIFHKKSSPLSAMFYLAVY